MIMFSKLKGLSVLIVGCGSRYLIDKVQANVAVWDIRGDRMKKYLELWIKIMIWKVLIKV